MKHLFLVLDSSTGEARVETVSAKTIESAADILEENTLNSDCEWIHVNKKKLIKLQESINVVIG